MKKLLILYYIFCSFQALAQIPPFLPNTSTIETCFPDTAGYTILTVGPADRDFNDLQIAINSAHPGTILILDAGASFKGSFSLPDKTGDGWIILTSSKMEFLPEQGQRIAPFMATGKQGYPSQQSAMPKIITTNLSGLPCFQTQPSAHHYRFVGLEITADTMVLNSYGLMVLGELSMNQNMLSEVPHDMIVDRCYIHGHTKANIMKAGVLLNAANSAVLDSYIADFHSIGADTYAIGVTNSPGPCIIRNNYLEAAGENILFGGAAPTIPGLVPSDMEIRNNYFFKPFSWRVGHPDYAGKHWTIKNLFELKTGRRVLFDGNILENCWADLPIGQSGYAILLTVRAESGNAPQADVSDITITNNVIRHVGAGITLSGHDSPTPSQQSQRIRIANNLFDDISGTDFGDGNVAGPNDGTFLKIGDPADVLIEHNTVLQSGAITWAYDTTQNIQFRNNLFQCFVSDGGYQGIYGPGFAQGGDGPMARYFPGITDANQQFHKNVMVGGPDFRYSNYNTLSQNYFPLNQGVVGFVDLGNGGSDYHGYALSGSSLYKNAGTDGLDLGVDMVSLDSALNTRLQCTPIVGTKAPMPSDNALLFPNPSLDGKVTLLSPVCLKDAQIVFFDFLGREIKWFFGIYGLRADLDLGVEKAVFWSLSQQGRSLGSGVLICRE